jgi:hypothetical protein
LFLGWSAFRHAVEHFQHKGVSSSLVPDGLKLNTELEHTTKLERTFRKRSCVVAQSRARDSFYKRNQPICSFHSQTLELSLPPSSSSLHLVIP